MFYIQLKIRNSITILRTLSQAQNLLTWKKNPNKNEMTGNTIW